MIVITGANGFLGSYLTRELKSAGHELFLTSRRAGLDPAHHSLDLDDPRSCDILPSRVDAVIHLAGRIPKQNQSVSFLEYMNSNADGTKRLLEAAAQRSCGLFVYASTQMVYDQATSVPVAEDHFYAPSNDYGFSKAVGEKYALSCATASMAVSSLRFSQLFGVGAPPNVLTRLVQQAKESRPMELRGPAGSKRDLLYVKDAVEAIVRAVEVKKTGAFNIGSGKALSVRELAGAILDVYGWGPEKLQIHPDFRDETRDFFLDTSRAQKVLGFKPRFDIRSGLLDYIQELSMAGTSS